MRFGGSPMTLLSHHECPNARPTPEGRHCTSNKRSGRRVSIAIDGITFVEGGVVDALGELIVGQDRESLCEPALDRQLKRVESSIADRFRVLNATEAGSERTALV